MRMKSGTDLETYCLLRLRTSCPWLDKKVKTGALGSPAKSFNLAGKSNVPSKATKRNPTNTYLWEKYKSIRNKVKYITAQSYHKFVNDLCLNCSNNPKKFWSFVSGQRKKSCPSNFHNGDPDSAITDNLDIADNFNRIFQSNFTRDTHRYLIPQF